MKRTRMIRITITTTNNDIFCNKIMEKNDMEKNERQ